MDEKLQQKLNEILILEESLHKKTNQYEGSQKKEGMLKKLSDTLIRGPK